MKLDLVDDNKKADFFSSSCFWELDRSKLSLDKSRSYIITRIVNRGNMDDIKMMFDYYGWDIIKEEVVKIRYLNDKILNWLSSLFEINPKEFRCYNNRDIF
jgi:hypothetical protein